MNIVAKQYANHLVNCFELAENGISKIDEFLMNMQGMTGIKTRHLYNNILSLNDSRYLEIGTWKGSSACSAMAGNKATVLCIDNWSQFFGYKDEFIANFENYKGDNSIDFIESDCFKVDTSSLGKYNIYMYDGDHSSESHEAALTYFKDCLDDVFIYIIDDWNWEHVRTSTINAIEKLGLSIAWQKEIITRTTEQAPVIWDKPDDDAKNNWWNGIAVFVLVK
jgi:hypothetical protein